MDLKCSVLKASEKVTITQWLNSGLQGEKERLEVFSQDMFFQKK